MTCHRAARLLGAVALLAGATTPLGATQSSGWRVIGSGTVTTYYDDAGGYELYVDIDHQVQPGEIGVTFLVVFASDGGYTITRETTRFLGAEANGTLHLELAGDESSVSRRRAAELDAARAGSLERYGVAVAQAMRADDVEKQEPARRILLPTITPDAAPAFQWVYAPQTLPVAPFPRLLVTYDPDGFFEVRPRDDR